MPTPPRFMPALPGADGDDQAKVGLPATTPQDFVKEHVPAMPGSSSKLEQDPQIATDALRLVVVKHVEGLAKSPMGKAIQAVRERIAFKTPDPYDIMAEALASLNVAVALGRINAIEKYGPPPDDPTPESIYVSYCDHLADALAVVTGGAKRLPMPRGVIEVVLQRYKMGARCHADLMWIGIEALESENLDDASFHVLAETLSGDIASMGSTADPDNDLPPIDRKTRSIQEPVDSATSAESESSESELDLQTSSYSDAAHDGPLDKESSDSESEADSTKALPRRHGLCRPRDVAASLEEDTALYALTVHEHDADDLSWHVALCDHEGKNFFFTTPRTAAKNLASALSKLLGHEPGQAYLTWLHRGKAVPVSPSRRALTVSHDRDPLMLICKKRRLCAAAGSSSVI